MEWKIENVKGLQGPLKRWYSQEYWRGQSWLTYICRERNSICIALYYLYLYIFCTVSQDDSINLVHSYICIKLDTSTNFTHEIKFSRIYLNCLVLLQPALTCSSLLSQGSLFVTLCQSNRFKLSKCPSDPFSMYRKQLYGPSVAVVRRMSDARYTTPNYVCFMWPDPSEWSAKIFFAISFWFLVWPQNLAPAISCNKILSLKKILSSLILR